MRGEIGLSVKLNLDSDSREKAKTAKTCINADVRIRRDQAGAYIYTMRLEDFNTKVLEQEMLRELRLKDIAIRGRISPLAKYLVLRQLYFDTPVSELAKCFNMSATSIRRLRSSLKRAVEREEGISIETLGKLALVGCY